MNQPRKIAHGAARAAAMLLALCVTDAARGQTAQPPPTPPPTPTPTPMAAVDIAFTDQPIPAERLADGRRFLKAMSLETRLGQMTDQRLGLTRDQALAAAAQMKPAVKARYAEALEEALAGQREQILTTAFDRLSRYYATVLSPDEMGELLLFYESPQGQKLVWTPQDMSDAEKQAVEAYAQKHRALFKIIAITAGSEAVTTRVATQPNLAPDFKARFCKGLAAREVSFAWCAPARP